MKQTFFQSWSSNYEFLPFVSKTKQIIAVLMIIVTAQPDFVSLAKKDVLYRSLSVEHCHIIIIIYVLIIQL